MQATRRVVSRCNLFLVAGLFRFASWKTASAAFTPYCPSYTHARAGWSIATGKGQVCPHGVKTHGFKTFPHSKGLASCLLLQERKLPAGRLCMALIDGPPPNSGGESWPSEGLGTDAAQGQLVPPSVSHRELHFFLLQKTMWHAVAEERYDEAQRLKRELKVLRTYLRTTLVRKLQSRVEKMRVAHERKLQTSALARAQHELAAALAVEDYSAAAQAQHSIEQEEARANSMSGWWKRTIMRRMAWILMQASIRSRVSTMRLLHARALQDPKKRLEHELKAAVDDENFERAVVLRDKLKDDELDRDIKSMHDALGKQIRAYEAGMRQLEAHEGRLLEYKLAAAINAEDYDAACALARQIKDCELRLFYGALQQHLQVHRHADSQGRGRAGVEQRAKTTEEREIVCREYWYGGLLEEEKLRAGDELEKMLEEALEEEDYASAAMTHAQILASDRVALLQSLLQQAGQGEDWARASALKNELLHIYTSTLSSPLLSALANLDALATASMSAAPKPEVASGQHTDTTTKKTKIDSNSSSLCALSESAESNTGLSPEGRGGAGMAQVEEEKQQHASLEHKGTADAVAHLVGMGKGGKRTQVDTQSNSGTHKDGRPLRVGQLVEHKSLGFRGVVLGHTRVCAAPSSWMEHHRIDELPRGREQYFYHIIPDTRDVSLHPPPCHTEADAGVLDEDKDRDATRVQHKRYSLSIADCSPAFLCGQDLHDVCPFMLTGYVAADDLQTLDLTVPRAATATSVAAADKRWQQATDGEAERQEQTAAASLRALLQRIFASFFKSFRGVRKGPVLHHPAVSTYFNCHQPLTDTSGSYLKPYPCVEDIVLYHMPEWLT